MPKIFVVDDDDDILLVVKTWCEKKKYEVTTYNNADNLLKASQELRPDVILLDINLSGKDGRYVCQQLKHDLSHPVKIILFSANPIALLQYQEYYADGVLNKPFEFAELENKITRQLTS